MRGTTIQPATGPHSSVRYVIEWQACEPFGERALLINTFATMKTNRVSQVLGHVWPKMGRWCASDKAGKFLGRFRTQEQARARVVQPQVLNGAPVLVRSLK
ncbi:hypothetical protein [Geothrix campi]|uniref:hypothetical protein n=1 Tax=Geothrix campi TaxID=2966450 RepID=UPI0021486388|nr:hypothetical protein [Geothrix sp. SG10]